MLEMQRSDILVLTKMVRPFQNTREVAFSDELGSPARNDTDMCGGSVEYRV